MPRCRTGADTARPAGVRCWSARSAWRHGSDTVSGARTLAARTVAAARAASVRLRCVAQYLARAGLDLEHHDPPRVVELVRELHAAQHRDCVDDLFALVLACPCARPIRPAGQEQ